ncbi:ATP citrate lyase citrate-binding domain-containing protein, partial [Desulfurella sp.]|uniref:ATP citrate lyase citrate-binding domain-containing protein n=1 Tax=Desulfurella sp. TaxID=1962857 RepID=UPI0025C3A7D5
YQFFKDLHFTYFEINPLVIFDNRVFVLDLVAKIDDTAMYLVGKKWGDIDFTQGFSRALSKEEKYIKELDKNSGASLKLTILNPKGRIWLLIAGGGASVVYADAVANLGYSDELANYGEYSGNPSRSEVREYTETIFHLMTKENTDNQEKILLIGGAIANFTDVSTTFDGIIDAFVKYADKLKQTGIKIYVRRGGPNYLQGLNKIKQAAFDLGLDIEVYGPEVFITDIVDRAILSKEIESGVRNESRIHII